MESRVENASKDICNKKETLLLMETDHEVGI